MSVQMEQCALFVLLDILTLLVPHAPLATVVQIVLLAYLDITQAVVNVSLVKSSARIVINVAMKQIAQLAPLDIQD
jgi:hypothetical protein